MNRVVLLSALLVIGICLSASAQNNRYSIEITPAGTATNPVIVAPGTPVQFTARVYEYTPAGKIELQLNAVQWSVDPASFGSISGSGQFLVGPANTTSVSGRVIGTVAMAGLSLQGASHVATGHSNTGPYTFTGMVTAANNTPIAGATVSVMSAGLTPFLISGHTNVHGIYSIQVPAGTYAVRAEAQGLVAEFFDDVPTITLATKFTTDPNRLVYDHIDFVLGSGGSISGTVTDAATAAPLPGVQVAIEIASNTRPPTSSAWSVQTGHDGKYTISGLQDGQYVVFAQGQSFIFEYYNDQKDRTNANPVVVTQSSHVTGIDFALDRRPPDPEYSISGFVRDANAQPIAHAVVIANPNPAANLPVITGITDQTGAYKLIVRAGSWTVMANAQGFVPEWYDNAATANSATPVILTATAPLRTDVDFSLGTGGAIEGYVLNAATNLPVAGATVAAMSGPNSSTPSGGVSSHGMTDQNGFYRISGLAAGDYYVMAQANGFVLQYFDMAANLTLATKVSVTDGQTTPNIDFALGIMPGISGTVTNEATTLPISGAHVILDGPNTRAVAVTDAHGNYHLAAGPGTYKVRAVAQGYAEEWYNEQATYQAANDVVVPQNGDVTGIDFTLTRHGSSISGIVYDAANNPVAGAQVSVWINANAPSNSTATGYGKAVTAIDGSYTIDGLPAGSYIARANAAGFIPEFYNNAANVQTATAIVLAANQAATGIDFALEMGGAITGTVTNASTAVPIAHAYVHVRGSLHGIEFGARTDAHGDYRIEGLPSGNYTVFFAAPHFVGEFYDDTNNPALAAIVAVAAPSVVSDIDAALTPASNGPRKYNGSVSTGNPAMSSYVLVEAINPDNGLSMITTVDETGRFEFDAWDNAIVRARAIGHIGLYAGNTRYWKDSQTNGFTGSINFVLEPVAETGLAEMSGTVRDASTNQPLAGAWVYAADASGETFFAVTWRDGSFFLPNTTNGGLDVMVSEVRYETTNSAANVNEARGSADIAAQRTGLTSVQPEKAAPLQLALRQNYPNPFNPSTAITFTLPKQAKATLKVYNLLGKEVTTLTNDVYSAGTHTVNWNASGIATGIYLYRLETGGTVLTRRMALTK